MDDRMKRRAKLEWVPFEKIRVRHGVSQREFRPAWANAIAKGFKIEKLGTPILNHVGGWFWIVDGQHRIEALKQWLGDSKGQRVECMVYADLSEQEEADLFLGLNAVKAVRSFDKFTIALTAEREEETNIEAIVRLKHLKISEQKDTEGAISCVATLARVYRRCGADGLAQTLEIANEAFGDTGLEADIIDGLGLLSTRYNGQLDPKKAIRALGSVRGGVNTLRTRATRLRQQTGVQRAQCVAAAAVEIYNRGKGGRKLASWWKSEVAR